ncbi:hydroxymethylbilane synthase [Ekhidna lutea]|uniref:Hydroxymethylbilane synthase n=1 Tax=Ekhidna lutea TaxID=447679 RepID=A0A239EYI8_EKHLU|nr:hydroxymethylbilane synthase [Ekhidna lutea]SNS49736.1 hydroxymethylbilane synthase [Ekhidna lutea]
MERRVIKIGTRKSKLAMWQANYVADMLDAAGFQPQLVPIETKGDKIQHVALSKIGSKGVFTEELESMLRRGQIDVAVHSAKDLQSKLPDGFKVLSFCERESPDDVIVSDKEIDLNDPKLILGTSSTRRIAMLKHYYPHITTVDVRGNLQTRLEKMKSGIMDGLVLAYAGVRRMNYDDLVKYWFDTERFIPPVGQGSVAIEIHENLPVETASRIKMATNHPLTEKVLLAERAFLRRMDGGCSIPVFGHAEMESDGQIILKGGIASLDGKELIQRTMYGSDPEELGTSLADEILQSGGKKVLEDIKSAMS